ncbi:hypothetical protein C7H19_19470 [Aphanothece hegewaldii CCALA 016]|uniref:Uncharacterized protein n=1 Tax=Aphanothece hegewaldii CCALA 016 TaxID=2107694 RepID=A0A2T1LTF2_9CHRO|nr:hypothetical protein [Aphanothece hegewaldii]PSF33903.1 hypothetical protein C7H19_19470 [Aphanothece hegewaldii CCALA 016]
MSQENALDRLMKKQKPTVLTRIDVVKESVSHDVKTSQQQDIMTSISHDSKTTLSQDYQTQLNPDAFETVRNTIRIESTVDLELRQLCHDERITKETFLEAAYLYLTENPDGLAEVIYSAQERLQHRKAIADYKRAKTMQQRFLES